MTFSQHNEPLPHVELGVIGGSGLSHLFDEGESTEVSITTPYGAPSGPVRIGSIENRSVAFLARHGEQHSLPPHKVNYRANLWALARLGVRALVTTAAVGGLTEDTLPERFVIPDQLIDRTWGRADTFFDDDVQHLPAADPYCDELRGYAIQTLSAHGEDFVDHATSVVVQGPRFSTRAESAWFRSAGAHIVNMTQYPETMLAAELNVGLVNIAFVTDRDAGLHGGDPSDTVNATEVFARMTAAAPRVLAAVRGTVSRIPQTYRSRRLIDPQAVERVLGMPASGKED